MDVTMSNNAPAVPKKRHRNATKAMLEKFIASDMLFLSVERETIEDAKNMAVGAYNMCKRRGLDIQVWRAGCTVYMKKDSTDAEE